MGVAQYGIESVMPRGNTVSSAVEQTVVHLTHMPKLFAQRVTDMKYLEDRWYRVTDVTDAEILQARLTGFSTNDIANAYGWSQRKVQRHIRNIAETIVSVSYPQVSVASVAY